MFSGDSRKKKKLHIRGHILLEESQKLVKRGKNRAYPGY